MHHYYRTSGRKLMMGLFDNMTCYEELLVLITILAMEWIMPARQMLVKTIIG
jgi:hypothetical protein